MNEEREEVKDKIGKIDEKNYNGNKIEDSWVNENETFNLKIEEKVTKKENTINDLSQNKHQINWSIDKKEESKIINTNNTNLQQDSDLKTQNKEQPLKTENKSETSQKDIISLPSSQNIPQPLLPEIKSSPLLLKSEKEEAINAGQSLDSRKVDEAITIIDIENICRCLAHAILKHIEFSKGEVLIDDLVSEEEDIPQFSYEFGSELRIDLEEIQK